MNPLNPRSGADGAFADRLKQRRGVWRNLNSGTGVSSIGGVRPRVIEHFLSLLFRGITRASESLVCSAIDGPPISTQNGNRFAPSRSPLDTLVLPPPALPSMTSLGVWTALRSACLRSRFDVPFFFVV